MATKFNIRFIDHNSLILKIINYNLQKDGDRLQSATIELPIITTKSFEKIHFEINDVTKRHVWFYIR